DLVGRVAEGLRLQAHEKGLELCVRILPDVPPRLSGDPLRLRQVLSNLLENAIKFTAHGDVVLTVEGDRLRPRMADLRFTVKDTGVGMSPEQLETIFQAFSQGGASVGREYSGSGLGLAIAKRLVDLMGSQLKVTSAKGAGSTFYFTAEFGVLAPSPAQTLAAAPDLQGLHLLVVDDNDSNRLILREFLGSKGAEVVETDKWEYATAELQRQREAGHRYNLILLDCTMPGIDGLEVAQRFRHEGIETVIPMITANDLNAKLARMRELGIQAYVVKPVRQAQLIRAIGVAQGVTDAGDEKPLTSAPVQAEPEIEPRRILLADDSPHNRLLIKHYLKELPYELDMAENGEVALNKFVHKSYDLVLMDLRMPVMDGHMAVRR
ncbi:MAG TPA: response regulator, partial [Thermoanaerobaculia bacterium]|nr:response regulator [Thermoanaerobaculia bacterium]